MSSHRALLAPAAVLAVLLAGLAGCTDDAAPGPSRADASSFLLAEDPEELTRAVDRAVGRGRGDLAALRSVLVQQGGELVVERYYVGGPDASANTASVTKSVLGALVGIAVAEGELTLDQRLDESLPAYADRMRGEVASITVRELLTMTAGLTPDSELDLTAWLGSDDWVGEILRQGVVGRKGEFAYSSQGSHLLGAVLTEAVGTSLLEYADRRLLGPLGIDLTGAATPVVAPENVPEYDGARFAWPTDPTGLFNGFAFLKLRPQDLVRLGRLYLDEGRWQGRQLVPRRWVAASTRDHVGETGQEGLGYGYHWWTAEVEGHHAFGAIGAGGQLVQVVPDMQLVVVATSTIGAEPPLDGVDLAVRIDRAVLPALEPR